MNTSFDQCLLQGSPGKVRRRRAGKMGETLVVSTAVSLFILASLLTRTAESAVLNARQDSSSSITDEFLLPSEPIKIKLLAPSSVSRKNTRTRQNSRFLRTFPPIELLNLARQTAIDDDDDNDMNEIEPMGDFNYPQPHPVYHHHHQTRRPHPPSNYYGSMSSSSSSQHHHQWPMKANRIEAGNSPIFYIKLPPVPYVYMPGVGYVSPHPYSNAPSLPMSMTGGQAMVPPDMGSFIPFGQESSSEQNQSVISLPLKFLSNGRPHQIESSKRNKKKRPGSVGIKDNSSSEKQGASLISGGKYSFNGRPTAVFVVRSPVGSSIIEK